MNLEDDPYHINDIAIGDLSAAIFWILEKFDELEIAACGVVEQSRSKGVKRK